MKNEQKKYFLSLSSGSSGNCSYIGDGNTGFLIDAGVPFGLRTGRNISKTLKQSLSENNIDIRGIKGLVISHCHHDHIRYAADYSNNGETNIPVYIDSGTYTMYEILRSRQKNSGKSMLKGLGPVNFIEPDRSFFIDSCEILPTTVTHDASLKNDDHSVVGKTLAFIIKADNKYISHITDLGEVTENLIRHSRDSKILHIEFNYDPEMLISGNYPLSLKKRVRSRYGHLSNQEAVNFILSHHINTAEHISVAHVSKNNNSIDKIKLSIGPIIERSNIKFHKTFHGRYSDKIYL